MPKKPRSVSTPAAALGSTKKSKSAASKKQKDEKMALDSSADLDEVPVSADSDVADVEPKEEQQSVPKNMPTHPNLQADQIRKAFAALLKHREITTAGKKPQLIETDPTIYISLVLNKVPRQANPKPRPVILPHSLRKEAEICIFVKDPAKEVKKVLRSQDLPPNVKKIMGIKKLREEWNRYEARRKLLRSYDMFLCDDRVTLILRSLLGKAFFEAKKFPIPIKVNKKNVTRQIELARDSTFVYISMGANISVPIAKLSFEPEQVVENVIKSIDKIVNYIPNKWKNIRTIALRTVDSPSLPIYHGPIRCLTKKPSAQNKNNNENNNSDNTDNSSSSSNNNNNTNTNTNTNNKNNDNNNNSTTNSNKKKSPKKSPKK